MNAERKLFMAGRTAAPANETKGQAFKRVGTTRINNAMKAIGLLEALANKQTYEYTSDQQKLILDSLNAAVARVKDAFDGKAVASGGVTL
jgi:hypothetical protein